MNPEFMVRNQLLVLTFTLLMSLLILVIDLVGFFFPNSHPENYIVICIVLMFIVIFFMGKLYKQYFSRKRLVAIRNRYKIFLPSYWVYSLIVFLTFFFLLLGPSLAVLLTGGTMLGERFYGILRN